MNDILERLAEEGLKVVLEVMFVGVLALVTAILARSLVRRGRVWIGANAGRTCMSPYVLLVGLLCAVAAVAFLVLGFYFRESLRDPRDFYAWVGLVGGFTFFSLLMLPLTRHTWEWDASGLRWGGAWRSISMRWPDLVRLGRRMSGELYVTDKAGRKISWSPQYTLEHEALLRAIQTARPDLVLPS